MNQPSNINLLQTRNFGDLITDSFAYVRNYYKSLGKSVLYFVVPVVVITGIFMGFYMQQIFSLNPSTDPQNAISDFTPMFTSLFGAAIFGMLASAALSAVAFNHMALVAESGNVDPTVTDIWNRFKKDIWALLAIGILTGLLTFVGTIFFIIPGIILYIKFALIPVVYVKERNGIGDAFSRSWNLTTNYWWVTFGVIFVMGMLVSFMSYFLAIPIMLISALAGFAGADIGTGESIFAAIYGTAMVLGYVFYVLVFITLGLHYFNLVERKEGSGLKERIDQINQNPSI